MPSSPPLASATPGRSRCMFGPRLSVSRACASGATTRPIGTLIQKIHCQESPLTTAPPMTGPSATPRPLTPDQMPSATPRCPSGNASESSVSVSGNTSAPPAPCTARAAIRVLVGCDGGRRGGGREDAQSDREHPPATEAVAQRGAGHQQDGERQRVRVDDPLEPAQARTEVDPDRAGRWSRRGCRGSP